MDKVITIIDKEWSEVFKNGMVLMTVLLLPLLFTILPLVILYFMGTADTGGNVVSDMPSQFTQMCGSLGGMQCTQVYIINEFMMLFLMLPLAIPAAISAYSIVGEKTTRCLEPLLATPITTRELIVGKAVAASLPAIAATWVAYAAFAIGARILVPDPAVSGRVLDPQWLIAIALVGPLMAIAAVNVSIIVSSRTSDPRTAEQISMLVLIPVLGVFLGQMAGLFLLNTRFILISAAVLLLIDAGLVRLGVGLFQRETILTRWK